MSFKFIFKKTLYIYIAIFIIVCYSYNCFAQLEFANGIDFVCPVLKNKYNNKNYYGQLGGGLHLGISYKPESTQFFPTLHFSFGATKLPITDFNSNVATVNMNYLNLMLNGNIVIRFRNGNALFLLEGIGLSNLKHGLPAVSGPNAGSIPIHLDSTQNIDKFFPAMGGGLEYVYGEAINKSLYLVFGLYFQYIILYPERNSYFETVKSNQGIYQSLSGGLIGDIIFPSFYLSLHYIVSKNILFWKNKNKKYL